MNVSLTQPFTIIYSFFMHEYLGHLLESFIVQLDGNEKLTFRHQNISSKNAKDFEKKLDTYDFKLINLIDSIQQDVIARKFSAKPMKPIDFFIKIYHPEKGDKAIQEAIAGYIDRVKAEIFDLLFTHRKQVYEMGSDGEPTWKKLYMEEEPVTVLFHFRRNEDNTHYFPTLKHKGQKLEFQYKNAQLLCYEPAWLLIDNSLLHFQKELEGHKLKPFLNKKFIAIPRKVEENYFQKFVTQLVAAFDVYAVGFEIKTETAEPNGIITLSEYGGMSNPTLFGAGGEEAGDIQMLFEISFRYGTYVFSADRINPVSVSLEKTEDSYVFHRVRRKYEAEKEILSLLAKLKLTVRNGKVLLPKYEAFDWLHTHKEALLDQGFEIVQNFSGKRYFMGRSSIDFEIKENNDWFDIFALVKFGQYEIPFIELRKIILSKKKEFILPSGEIAVIPDEWFTKYSDLLGFTGEQDKNIRLQRYHLSLVNELAEGNMARVTMDRKLERLRDFAQIEDYPMPEGFRGSLRPYQKAGFNWMMFLKSYNFGGCLADDMGLGKTVQTLALLQSCKELQPGVASLLIVPTSLIYNWELEAAKFAPDLKLFKYTGIQREKNVAQFEGYDLIITSYGTSRRDADILCGYYFNYIILDESQAIKNPDSVTAKELRRLKSKHRLILTGTPVENSTLDLWSQLSFANPGLLGTLPYFKKEYQAAIEKKKDDIKTQKLHTIIKPFILRRKKTQVATDLPDKTENIHYSEMSEEQSKVYEETKSHYRNSLIEKVEKEGIQKSHILILQGLNKLRQIANHPQMTDPDYTGDSGKMEDMMHMLEKILEEDHKILIFSSFVKHLTLVRQKLDDAEVPYAYLDGSTADRQQQVELFQTNPDVKVFLLSIKAGGVGLNLTAADYVFILDPWWNPAVEAQAVDRAHRIGQKNNVFTYKFISKNTLEEKILTLQQTKQKLADDLITTEESFVKSLSKEDILSLLD